MSTLLWLFISLVNHMGVKADFCSDRTVVIGTMCKNNGEETESLGGYGSSLVPVEVPGTPISNGI